MPAPLTEGQFATIDWVLKRYRDAQDRTEGQIEAVANIAPDLDGWLRSLLEIVKSHKITWVSCEERKPGHTRPVWIYDPSQVISPPCQGPIDFADGWDADLGEWWIGDRTHLGSEITHWADIQWPQPPEKEGGGEHDRKGRHC